jgi:hypothetical protein
MYAYDVHPRLTLVSFVVFNTRVPTGDRTELYVLKAGENEFHLKHIVPLYAVPLLLLPACLSLTHTHVVVVRHSIGEELQDGNGGNMVSDSLALVFFF